MSEFCSMKILCESRHGKMYTCTGCEDKIVFAYKNITQSMTKVYFQKFEKNISTIQFEAYFRDFPNEKSIHIRTEWSTLFYSFTKTELRQVKSLFQQANFKLKLYERYELFLN